MEKAIKQRLLGGLVLVAGAALLLPILLDGSGSSLTIPSMPTPPEVPGVEAVSPKLDEKVKAADQAVEAAHAERTLDVEGDGGEVDVEPAEAAPPAQPADAASGTAGKPAPATAPSAPAPKPVEKAAAAKPAAPSVTPAPAEAGKTATKPAAPAALPQAWVVQVASLSSREKAEAMVKTLRGKGYPAVLRPQGGSWKVMVGPELSRDVAETLKSRLAADPQLRLNGWVQAYKP